MLSQPMDEMRGIFQISGVLKGIRVVEQGTFITSPCAGIMLGDPGADVIKVESVDGGRTTQS
jgi:crotonobetainyl-CoA:carnitine CoA-transferase CaiB-like acyl-CoA transferase